eukprot:9209970-Ditylum_brightwellii.AAC.2
MKAMPKDEMILSTYMHSNHYCSYPKKQGRNSVRFLGQVNQIIKNFMCLLVLIEMAKGNKLHSNIKSFLNKGKGVYEGAHQKSSDFWTEQTQPHYAIATQYRKEKIISHQSKPISWATQ